MRTRVKIAVLVTAGATLALAGFLAFRDRKSSAWLESRRLPDGTLPEADTSAEERARLIGIARDACDGVLRMPEDAMAFIEETETTFVVTFPIFRSRPVPGSDFYAQIHIRKSDGVVLRKMGSC